MSKTLKQECIEVDLDLTLEQAHSRIKTLIIKHGKEATLNIQTKYDYGDEYAVAKVCWYRPYTKAEMQADADRKEEELIRDRAMWERLDKKFGVVSK